jgi:D-alanyl-lipoteichoic acid acyltransferase DltB (MBOAT superfamily)
VYTPSDLFRARSLEARGVLTALLLVALKGLAHAALARWLPSASYGALDATRAATASRAELWGVVLVGYLDLALTLSGTADLAILVARLYGWPMASPFRWALLAWNPAELWRRWGLYNRKWLLQQVYFPLGGGTRHKVLNVMATFLGSALLLHTGWFGSKYWEVGPGGWRDETVYFLLQGTLVCGWLAFAAWRGNDSAKADHTLRLTWSRVLGTAATQTASAFVHVVVLAQAIPFGDRWRVMGRLLGL